MPFQLLLHSSAADSDDQPEETDEQFDPSLVIEQLRKDMQEVVAAVHQGDTFEVVNGMKKGAAKLKRHALLLTYRFYELKHLAKTLAYQIKAQAKQLLNGKVDLPEVVSFVESEAGTLEKYSVNK